MNARNFPHSLLPLDRLFESLGDIAQEAFKVGGFPYHDIIAVNDTSLRLVFALAGYSEEEIELVQEGRKLTVAATKVGDKAEGNYLHRGIARSAFSREFKLPPYSVIDKAELKNGLLTIDIKIEVPEEQKPRKIEILTKKSADAPEQAPEEPSGE